MNLRHLFIGLMLASLPTLISAATVSDLTAQANGTYVMKIDGARYVAFSEADLEQIKTALSDNAALKQKLAETTAKLEEYQALTTQYEELKGKYAALTNDYRKLSEDSIHLNGEYSTAANNLVILNQDYSKLVKDYDSLTEKYRNVALRSRPRSPLDLGIGMVSVNNTNRGIAMIGAGTQMLDIDVRGWLFGGEDTYGVLLGTSF